MTLQRTFRFLAPALVAAAAFACGGDDVSNPENQGTLSVMITDAPIDGFQSLLVTFSEVSVHRSGAGDFARLPFAGGASTRTCNLKRLSGAQSDMLGVGALPAGHYTEVRLTVTGAFVDADDSTPLPACSSSMAPPPGAVAVEVPSGEVKLVPEFDVKAGATTTLLLDFDGSKSLRAAGAGGFILQPVIRVDAVSGP